MPWKTVNWPDIRAIIDRLPYGQYYDGDSEGSEITFQCGTQKEVRAVRACFPGVVWDKEWNEGCSWWEYRTMNGDIKAKIYACREAPPTCKATEEHYESEETVPVTYETRKVMRTRLVWDCAPDPEDADA